MAEPSRPNLKTLNPNPKPRTLNPETPKPPVTARLHQALLLRQRFHVLLVLAFRLLGV